MSSPLPTIPEKDRDSSFVGGRHNRDASESDFKNALTKTPRKILQIATSKNQDQASCTAQGTSEKSPTTPSSFAPTLHSDEDQHIDTHHSSKETPDHNNIGKDPRASTFSRAPTISESDHQLSIRNPGNDSERSTSGVTEGDHQTATPCTFQRLRSVRWRGVLAMTAGVFAQMLCWGLIMTFGTILSFVSQLGGLLAASYVILFCPIERRPFADLYSMSVT